MAVAKVPGDPDNCALKCTTETMGEAIGWANQIGPEYEAYPCHKKPHFHLRIKRQPASPPQAY